MPSSQVMVLKKKILSRVILSWVILRFWHPKKAFSCILAKKQHSQTISNSLFFRTRVDYSEAKFSA